MTADEKLAAKGCEVKGGMGCFYKGEEHWCEPCKARRRVERFKHIDRIGEKWRDTVSETFVAASKATTLEGSSTAYLKIIALCLFKLADYQVR